MMTGCAKQWLQIFCVPPANCVISSEVEESLAINLDRDIRDAISRESQLKKWSRMKKVALINRMNPSWLDLGADVLQDRLLQEISRLRSK